MSVDLGTTLHSIAFEASLAKVVDRAVVLAAIAIGGLGLLVLLMGASETALLNTVAARAVDEAQQAAAWQKLGEPVQTGQASGLVVSRERVEVVVPVRGMHSRGKLHATAIIENGETRLTSVQVTVGRDRLAIPLAGVEEGER